MMERGKERVAHIFPQAENHGDAVIVANRAALLCMKEAIEQALGTGEGDCVLMPADGENYVWKVILNDENWQEPFWQRMKTPYAALIDEMSHTFGPEVYTLYKLRKSEEIPAVEETLKQTEKENEEWAKEIRDILKQEAAKKKE